LSECLRAVAHNMPRALRAPRRTAAHRRFTSRSASDCGSG
jgi:hypothetical protein